MRLETLLKNLLGLLQRYYALHLKNYCLNSELMAKISTK